MDITKVEKAFYWAMVVIGLIFFISAFFMKSRLDIVMRTVFGGLMAIGTLSEIYPGIVAKTSRRIASTLISACVRLTRKIKRCRRKEKVDEADIIETERL